MRTSIQEPAKRLTHASILFIMMIIVAGTTLAGTGKFEPDGNGGGKFNFCVSVRFNATEAQLQIIRNAFEGGSQVLADATDGHHRFGTINIVNNSGASAEAEFWIALSGGQSVGTYGQFGKKGQHAMIFGLLVQVPPDVQNFWNTVYAFTIAHEFSHHAYGLADEYVDRNGHMGANASCPPPPADVCNPDLDYCLMDTFSQRGGGACSQNVRQITMNEFCTASNHDKPNSSGVGGGETAQSYFNHRSCWETIARLKKAWKIPAPTQVVSAAPAFQAVTFGTSCGKAKVAIVIDRSGSMTIDNRLSFAKLGAEQFINSFANGSLAVVSFSNSASVNYTLTDINDDIARNNAKAAVNALAAGGATNIGDGLLAALAQLRSQGDCSSCEKTIILLSDGEHNVGTPPEAVISQLNNDGVKLITSVVGASISVLGETSLQTITTATNGEYYRVSTASDATAQLIPGYGSSGLVGLFTRLGSDVKGDALLSQQQQLVTSGQVKEIPTLIETRAANVTFTATLADQTDNIVLSLRSPSGVIYTGSSSPNVEFTSSSNSRSFRVNAPEQGTWTTVVTAGSIRTGKVEVLLFAKHDGVRLDASVSEQTVAAIDKVQIYATPSFEGERVVGASVTGTVGRPDGSRVTISLFDDGLDSSGDVQANDGIYSALFNSYSADGTYVFELTAQNSTGRAYAGEPLAPGEPSNDKPIPAFTRAANTTATISGIDVTSGGAVWFDDVLPEGAIPHGDADGGASGFGEGDNWYWINANPTPLSGTVAHQSTRRAGFHQHYFEGAPSLMLNAGDKLFSYVFLDINDMPDEIMLQWNDSNNWEHRAYWGQNRIGFGTNGTNSRRYIGPLPLAGRWVRLEVPASLVGLEGSSVTGMAFSLYGGRATWDRSGRLLPDVVPPPPGDFVWVEDAVPPGSILETINDQWQWLEPHFSGTQGHRSFFTVNQGAPQFRSHSFRNAQATMNVQPGDVLFTYVFLDSRNMPDELVLQWQDGAGWEHRAFWGQNYYDAGITGTESRRYMGGMPLADRWVRLEVPASYVGLEGKVVSGMSYGFYSTVDHAGINWDYSGKSSQATLTTVTLSATAPIYQIPNGNVGATYSTNDRASQLLKFVAYPAQAAATVPMYRFRRPDGGSAEKFFAQCLSCYNNHGWVLDNGAPDGGIAWYVYPGDSTPGTVPLYLYHDSSTHYFLTTDLNEAGVPPRRDGIWGYVYASNPNVPSAPHLNLLGNTCGGLYWFNLFPNITGFKIERRLEAETNFAEIATVGSQVDYYNASCSGGTGQSSEASTTEMAAPAPTPAPYFRLKTINASGGSSYSNEVRQNCFAVGGNNCTDGRGANNPPTANIFSPVNGAVLSPQFAIRVNAFDLEGNGSIVKVEYYSDGSRVGAIDAPPYNFFWNNAPSGAHTLTIVATDNTGASTTSDAVTVTVTAPPVTSITSPADGAVFAAPADVVIEASAADADGSIAKVEFYQGQTKIGEDQTAPYALNWTNVPPGTYSLTAKATDNLGLATTSPAVGIVVNSPPTPIFGDDFNDNSLDPNKWTVIDANSLAVVTEESQQLRITLRPNTAAYNGVVSSDVYNLTGRTVQVEVAQPVSQAGWCENFMQVVSDAKNYYLIDVGGGSLVFRSVVNGVNDQLVIGYDPAAFPYWRIRHNEKANTVSFETSSDGVNWTTRKVVAAGFSLEKVSFYLYAGAWGTGNSNPGAAKYDNFQLINSP